MAFIKIGFIDVRLLDVVDILVVGYLIYRLFRLLRGSMALNIFIGIMLVFVFSLWVRALDMTLLSGLLGQFLDVGVIALLIVFQPEVRRFLLFIGKGNLL